MVIDFESIRGGVEKKDKMNLDKSQSPRKRKKLKPLAIALDNCYGYGFSAALRTAYLWSCEEREKEGLGVTKKQIVVDDLLLWYPRQYGEAIFIDPYNDKILYRCKPTIEKVDYYELANYYKILSCGGDALRRLILSGFDLCDPALADGWIRPLLTDYSLDNVITLMKEIDKIARLGA